jgi:hypothetical protein
MGAKANYTRYLPGFHRANSKLANFARPRERPRTPVFRFGVRVAFAPVSFVRFGTARGCPCLFRSPNSGGPGCPRPARIPPRRAG